MKNAKFFQGSVLILLLIYNLFACTIETAEMPSKQHLVIASDYLTPSDTTLFTSFTRSEGIEIEVQTMTTDKLIGLIRNKGNNSGIDLVMTKSVYDAFKLNKREILHDVHFSETQQPYTYSSSLHNFYGIGIDPYIIINADSNQLKMKTYNDLTNNDFINELGERELTPLLAAVMKKMKRVQANNWIKKFFRHSLEYTNSNDSIRRNAPILTTASSWSVKQGDSLYSNRKLIFPNRKSTGSFFNIRTIGIIRQAENYVPAQKLINHCLIEQNNQAINDYLRTYSIFSTGSRTFRKYNVPINKLIEQYVVTDRVILRFQ